MKRVLVVDALQEFLANERVPASVAVTTFAEAGGVPATECDGVIPIITTRINAADMDRLAGLKVIANYGVGYDNIDVQAAHERGIAVSNTPGVLTDATAELTIALMMAAARRLGEGERLLRSGQWQGWLPTQLRGRTLKGATLGIIGAGRIGREVGVRARGLGMEIIYWSRSRHVDWELESGARMVGLNELMKTADVVSVHLPKSNNTNGMIGADALAAMKDGAVFVNTARGSIVDEGALISELRSGRISAGLDVYHDEPNVAHELLELENVVALPHIGSATMEARQAMWDLAWANVLCGVADAPLLNRVALT